MDCPLLHDTSTTPELLRELRDAAVESNRVIASELGIPQSMAVTCVKPSGTVSKLVDSSSGMHPRYNKKYLQTVRMDNKDPLTKLMIACNVPNEPCLSKPDSTTIFSFMVSSSDKAVCRHDMTALEQLELWKMYQLNWCEHKPSVTIYVEEKEWVSVGAWVWENFDLISGISFLPKSDHSYRQAPWQDCTDEEYLAFPKVSVDWARLGEFELEDATTSAREYACAGGACELD